MAGPDCFRCRYLKITWDQDRPYGCQGMGFKSHDIPWRVVLATSGEPCRLFKPKLKGDQDQEPPDE